MERKKITVKRKSSSNSGVCRMKSGEVLNEVVGWVQDGWLGEVGQYVSMEESVYWV